MPGINYGDDLFKRLEEPVIHALVPKNLGVYFIFDDEEQLLFIGAADGQEGRGELPEMLVRVAREEHDPEIAGAAQFKFLQIGSPEQSQEIARKLLTQYYREYGELPPVNGK